MKRKGHANVKIERKVFNMAKKVFDRIYATFIIVLNSIWGLVISVYSVVCLFVDKYDVEQIEVQFFIGVLMLLVANLINYFIRKRIREY